MNINRSKLASCLYLKLLIRYNIVADRMFMDTNNCHKKGLSREKSTSESSLKPTLFEGGMFVLDASLMENFNPGRAVATCFMEWNGKILLLKRNDLTFAGNTWCLPGGKLEKNETPLAAALRETKEETGIQISPENMNLIRTIFVRMLASKQDYPLHLFKTILPESHSSQCKVILNHEHKDYIWIDPIEAQQLNLIPSGKEILALYQSGGENKHSAPTFD